MDPLIGYRDTAFEATINEGRQIDTLHNNDKQRLHGQAKAPKDVTERQRHSQSRTTPETELPAPIVCLSSECGRHVFCQLSIELVRLISG